MKKCAYRDYATEGFRIYAQLGNSATYKQRLWNEAIAENINESGGSGISKPTESAIIHAEKRLDEYVAVIADLEAAESAIRMINNLKEGSHILATLNMVYMKDPFSDIERNVISERVLAAQDIIGASEKTIYRWLAKARLIFAAERGLRT